MTFVADSGSSSNFNNCVTAAAATGRVYGFKQSNEVFRVDTFVPAFTLLIGFTGIPFLLTLTPDEQSLLFLSFSAPVTIDRLSTASETFTNDVYTFTPTLAVPRDAQTRTVVRDFAAPPVR